ncbi:PspC domain-containing protein [Mucilaginibacter segetis]|uniref:PspC domain-containing protein n=1 Tax=Mucilaginibacter segetis TaxID=2793071 RepID=A0A934PQ81_9SPHI|nr:PspC domain-containing protein [Mucilaginibacter segetis]MBK0377687.1 PspC domain-containing protein [Mucilaginibacter segetis]
MEKKLYRDEHRKAIGGVCAGLADYFSVDVAIVRALFLILLLVKGVGVLPYIVLWIVLPKRDYRFDPPKYSPGVDYTVPPQQPGQPFQQPFPHTPPMPAKKPSNVGLIFGVVLIVLGASFLLDELDIIPDWDYGKLWPLALVALGGVLIFSGQKKQPWEKDGWNSTGYSSPVNDKASDEKTSMDIAEGKEEDENNDNPTTI